MPAIALVEHGVQQWHRIKKRKKFSVIDMKVGKTATGHVNWKQKLDTSSRNMLKML